MAKLTSKWKILAVVMGLVAAFAAFGIALAATVQVTQEVPSTMTIQMVDVVLPDDNLKLFHDTAGTDPVTSLEFVMFVGQPPLDPAVDWMSTRLFMRNDSTIPLKIIEPCRDLVDDVTDDIFGHVNANMFSSTDEFLGSACDGKEGRGGVLIAPGETLRVSVDLHGLTSVPIEDHSFTVVFGAIGEEVTP